MFATIQARTFRLFVFCIKNFNLESYETIFAMILYLCETWYLTDWGCLGAGYWEEYLDEGQMKWQEIGERCIVRSVITCAPLEIRIIRKIRYRRVRWTRHTARLGKRRVYVGYWWKAKGKGSLGRPEHRWVDNIKIYLRLVCLSGRLLWTRQWTIGFLKMLGSSWVAHN
jgi:hypothetical protein